MSARIFFSNSYIFHISGDLKFLVTLILYMISLIYGF